MSDADAATDDAQGQEPEDVTPTPEPAPQDEPAKPEPKVFDEDYVKQLRSEAAKHRSEAKKAAEELEKLRRAAMSEQERAIAEATDAGYKRALSEIGSRLVDAEIKAAAAGRFTEGQMAVLLQGLNRSAFLGEDGTVDVKSVQTFVDGLAPKNEAPTTHGFPDLGQGARSQAPPALNSDGLKDALMRAVGAPMPR
jgi:hypothetical protein